MTQPNILELAKHKLQKFYWPAWFPYPSKKLQSISTISAMLRKMLQVVNNGDRS